MSDPVIEALFNFAILPGHDPYLTECFGMTYPNEKPIELHLPLLANPDLFPVIEAPVAIPPTPLLSNQTDPEVVDILEEPLPASPVYMCEPGSPDLRDCMCPEVIEIDDEPTPTPTEVIDLTVCMEEDEDEDVYERPPQRLAAGVAASRLHTYYKYGFCIKDFYQH